MNSRRQLLQRLFLLLTLLPLSAHADEPVVGDLSALDRHYLNSQRTSIGNIAADSFGAQFSGDKYRDISLLQRILDERLVANDDTRKLQAMGVILGDLMATDLGMHWVIYEDKLGRSHALRYRESDTYLFPVTMISRRREVDNLTPIADIYNKVVSDTRKDIPALPFTGP